MTPEWYELNATSPTLNMSLLSMLISNSTEYPTSWTCQSVGTVGKIASFLQLCKTYPKHIVGHENYQYGGHFIWFFRICWWSSLTIPQLALGQPYDCSVSATEANVKGTGPLFTKRTDVLSQDLVRSRGREIRGLDYFNRSEIWQVTRQQRCRDACSSEIWQATRQQGCRDACQISERCDFYNI